MQLAPQQTQVPVCQRIRGTRSTTTSSASSSRRWSPAELDVYDRVMASLSEEREQVRRARQQQLERLRYQARLAERQYQKADPDNRLVAAELERSNASDHTCMSHSAMIVTPGRLRIS